MKRTKKRINSRQKGAKGERAAAKYLCSLGFRAERSARVGVTGGEDLLVHDLPGVWIEVKRVEGMDVGTKALEDALSQARIAAITRSHRMDGCVLWRPNLKGWRLTFEWLGPHPVTVAGDRAIADWLRVLGMEGKRQGSQHAATDGHGAGEGRTA